VAALVAVLVVVAGGAFGTSSASAAVLTVTLDGSMKGSVTSQPFGIKCSNIPDAEASACSFDFPLSSVGVKLSAVGADGAALRAWTGTGGGTCSGGASRCQTDPVLFTPFDITASFDPKPDRPSASTGAVSDITFPSAKASGMVHSNSADFPLTDCYIEYGPSTDYGATDECRPGAIGPGTTPVAVTGLLGMVASDTTYHYRVVAVNAGGKTVGSDQTFKSAVAPADSCPNATIRAQQGAIAQRLPSCWAYELVSPPSTLAQDATAVAIGDTGDAVLFNSAGAFADVGLGMPLSNTYRANRTAFGWVTESLTGPQPAAFEGFSRVDWPVNWWQVDRPVLMAGGMPAYDPDSTDNGNRYMVGTKGGEWNRISLTKGLSQGNDAEDVAATSEDMAGVLLRTQRRLPMTDGTTDTRNVVPLPRYSLVVSRRREDGTVDLRQVARKAGATMLPNCDIDRGLPGNGLKANAVDRDGLKRVIWSTSGTGCTTGSTQRIYVTEPFGDTPDAFEISVSQCTGTVTPCNAAQPVRFVGATTDTDRVFMTTTQKLLDSDTNTTLDIYEYDFNRVGSDRLRLVTGGAVGDDVLGVVTVSNTASHIYYVARGVVPGAVTAGGAPESGSPNLYVRIARAGEPVVTRFIKTLDAGDSSFWGTSSRQAVATPDGRYLVVTSSAALTDDKQAGDALPDVYRIDSATGQIDRAWVTDPAHNGSLRSDGASGPSSFLAHSGSANFSSGLFAYRIADDGSAITFSTKEPLVPGDVNKNDDVFVWTASDGVSMISDGRDSQGVTASSVRMSADGRSFMFMTRSQILSQHTATSVALYVVRRDGGFPVPERPAEPCVGEACQGPASGPSSPAGVGSSTLVGAGNLTSGRGVARLRLAKVGSVRGSSARITVKVTGKGKIRASGRRLSGAVKTASRAGTYAVSVKLSKSAKRALERKHRLTVRIAVRFTPSRGKAQTVRIPVTFRFAPASNRKQRVLSADGRKGR
jgi:hypothetical protein